jgi:2-oxoglutarate ferredoxin oxidoreductase subunit alpha
VVGGAAGDGIQSIGDMLMRIFKRKGLEVCTYRDFQSRIRGGHVNMWVRCSDEEIFARGDFIDYLIALDAETIMRHVGDMTPEPGGFVLYDSSVGQAPEGVVAKAKERGTPVYQIPFKDIAVKELEREVFRNVIAAAMLLEHMGLDLAVAKSLLGEMYSRKGEKVVAANHKAVDIGARLAAEHLGRAHASVPAYDKARKKMLVTGNQAFCLGAIVAGCRFISGYPITPATEVLEFMAEYLPRFGGVAIQAEDELSAVTMAIGAAYSGARSCTASSGPGISLMSEALGLSSVAEIPLVIVDVQRSGPSTGLPTKPEQSDLNHLTLGSHGEAPRIVIAPSSVRDAFYLSIEAFNLSEKYQIPVYFMTDLSLGQNSMSVPPITLDGVSVDRGRLMSNGGAEAHRGEHGYRRFEFAEDGISPRSIPGVEGGMYVAAGNEHDEYSHVTENSKNRVKMMRKRFRKLETMLRDLPKPARSGPEDAKLGFIAMGFAGGAVREAMEALEKSGVMSKLLMPRTIWPFPKDELRRFAESVDSLYVVEQNATGQLAALIRRELGHFAHMRSILRFDGFAFRPRDILKGVEEKGAVIEA